MDSLPAPGDGQSDILIPFATVVGVPWLDLLEEQEVPLAMVRSATLCPGDGQGGV